MDKNKRERKVLKKEHDKNRERKLAKKSRDKKRKLQREYKTDKINNPVISLNPKKIDNSFYFYDEVITGLYFQDQQFHNVLIEEVLLFLSKFELPSAKYLNEPSESYFYSRGQCTTITRSHLVTDVGFYDGDTIQLKKHTKMDMDVYFFHFVDMHMREVAYCEHNICEAVIGMKENVLAMYVLFGGDNGYHVKRYEKPYEKQCIRSIHRGSKKEAMEFFWKKDV